MKPNLVICHSSPRERHRRAPLSDTWPGDQGNQTQERHDQLNQHLEATMRLTCPGSVGTVASTGADPNPELSA